MKKKQILSSLMISGVLLSSIGQVSAATQAELVKPQTISSSTSQAGLSKNDVDTSNNADTTNVLNAKNTTTSDSSNPDDPQNIPFHVTGNREADSNNIWGIPLEADNIHVDAIKETKESENKYVTNFEGNLTIGLVDRGVTVELLDEAGNIIKSKAYTFSLLQLTQPIGSIETDKPVAQAHIKMETLLMGVEATYKFTDLEKPGNIGNTAPTISASDKTLKVGDSFDAFSGVTASDAEDGDLTNSVTVKSNNVDTSKAGIYHVTYSVKDSDGHTTEKTITVTVTSDSAPTISASDKTLKVGDSFDAFSGVTASDAEDGDLTNSVTVKSNNVDTSKAGIYHVTYSVKDSDGHTTEKTITVTVTSVTTSGTLTPNTYDLSGPHSVTGTYTGDVKSIKLKINGEFQPAGGTVSNGNFSYYVGPNKITKTTDEVVVIGYDASGNELDQEKVTITNSNSYGQLTPNTYDLSGTNHSVTGTYTGDVKSVRVEINGNLQGVGGTVSNGNFSYYVGGKVSKVTDKVVVIGYDASGNELDRENVTIINSNSYGRLTPNTYDLSGTNHSVTGTYTGDVKSVRVEINGNLQGVGGTVSNGNFSYYVGGKVSKVTDKVVVIGYDASGNELDRENVTIINSNSYGRLTPNIYDLSGTNHSVTGTYTGDVKSIKLKINGEFQPVGGTVSNGNFSYYVGPNKITKTTDEVVVVGYDASGKELDQEKVTLKAKETSGTVTPNEYDLSGTNHSVTGTYTGDIKSVKVEINGNLQGAGGTVSNGNFSYYVGGKISKTTDKVYVNGYDASGNKIDHELVTVIS